MFSLYSILNGIQSFSLFVSYIRSLLRKSLVKCTPSLSRNGSDLLLTKNSFMHPRIFTTYNHLIISRLFAVKTWWLEKDEFTFGKPVNNLTIIGHYTQMVWATTHEIGCGISKCYQYIGNSTRGRLFYNYVCNYCPT